MLSVLIVNWNTRDLLLACLQSLTSPTSEIDIEIIVEDNASSDGSADAARERFPQAKLIASDMNLGYAAGNNAAFAEAKGDYLLTLNPDTEVSPGQLSEAVEILSRHPEAACLAPKLIGPDGATQRSVRGFPTFLGIVGDLTGLGKIFPRSKLGSYRLPSFDYDKEGPAPQPMGTFLLFRRDALERVGDPKRPFDESFPIFFNEVDLLYRLRKAGLICLYTPKVAIQHLGAASTRQVKKAMIWESHKSLMRFFVKHHRRPWNAPLFPLLWLLINGSACVRARGFDAGFRR